MRVRSADDLMHMGTHRAAKQATPTLALTLSVSPPIIPERRLEQHIVDSPSHSQCLCCRSLRHKSHEFIAAIAKAQILLADEFLKALPGEREQLATDHVPVRVIDQLEVIQIPERQAH